MRTNIVLNEKLVNKAFKYSKAKTKKELINEALEEYVANHQKKNLLDLEGKIKFSNGYDYKKARE